MTVERRETVLVCDDDPDVAKGLELALSANYAAYSAHKVQIAIDMLKSDRVLPNVQDRYTAVIIDLAFDDPENPSPGFNEDGFQILQEAIKDPYIEPIVFTGTGNEAKVIRAMDLCAFKYVMKTKRKPESGGGPVLQEKTMSDVEQVVFAVNSASKIRAAILALESNLAGTDYAV